MSKNLFTIYQHPKTTKQGIVHKWYYYYYDNTGKKVQKACKKCHTREQAEQYIAKLDTPDNIINKTNLLEDIACDMFVYGSNHMARREQLGKSTYKGTINESRKFTKLIIEQWGNLQLKEIYPEMVMSYLFSKKRAGKWKNKFIQILNEIFSEAKYYKCKVRKLELEKFKVNPKKADAFTQEELEKLFIPENFPSYNFYLMFLLTLAGGLRLGETRAIKAQQVISRQSLIIIDGFIQTNGERTCYNKKGSIERPKHRVVFLSNYIIKLLDNWINYNKFQPDEYIFIKDNKPIRQELAESVFYKALQKIGLIPTEEPRPKNQRGEGRKKQIKRKIKPLDGRKLVPHSLRYTYITMMLSYVTSTDLMPMTGHTSEANVNYYHQKVLDMTIASLPKNLREATDNMLQWQLITKPLYPENPQIGSTA